MKILVFIQVDDNTINKMSLEALSCAQSLNASVSAVTFNENAANQLMSYQLDNIFLAKNEKLNHYNPLNYTKALEQLNNDSYNAIFFAHTYETRDWVPRLSARFDCPFISDCIDFKNENDALIITRQTYQGKLNSDLTLNSKVLCSIQSGCYKADTLITGNAKINTIEIDLSKVPNSIRSEEKFKEQKGGVDLTAADIIVSIGRGIGKEENLQIIHDLAAAIGGEIASSRPVVDSGWLESYHQVGSSGQTVTPKLYLALGISGAIQHVVGMKGSKNIVVINKDANAPLFEIADYGVVGDLFEIIPKLITTLQSR